jgi:hypothetical protein
VLVRDIPRHRVPNTKYNKYDNSVTRLNNHMTSTCEAEQRWWWWYNWLGQYNDGDDVDVDDVDVDVDVEEEAIEWNGHNCAFIK